MEKTVFIVWRSDCHDDGIAAIFSTREKAEEYLEYSASCDAEATIEEFDVDTAGIDRTTKYYDVVRRAGRGICISDIGYGTSTANYVTYDSEKRIFTVRAKTRKEAIAIAEERERYIEEHPDEYPALGKVCIVRKRTGSYPFIEDVKKYITYDFCTKEMALPENVEFRKILGQ